MNKLVSIIIPMYNVAEYINDLLFSVTHQTYENIEIVIIEDGSTDRTLELCNIWAEKDCRIKLISQANSGVSYSRNIGITHSKGEYIYFMDADDYIDLDYIENLTNSIKNSDIAVSGYVVHNSESEVKYLCVDEFPKKKDAFVAECLKPDTFVSGYLWNKLFKREIIKKTMMFNDRISYSEDTLFLIEYVLNCQKFSFSPKESFYHYKIRNGSSTISKYNRGKKSVLSANDEVSKLLNSANMPNSILSINSSRKARSIAILMINIIETELNEFSMDYKEIKALLKKDIFKYLTNKNVNIKLKIFLVVCCLNDKYLVKIIKNHHKKKF